VVSNHNASYFELNSAQKVSTFHINDENETYMSRPPSEIPVVTEMDSPSPQLINLK